MNQAPATVLNDEIAALNWAQLWQFIHNHHLLPVVHQVLHRANLMQALPNRAIQTKAQQQMVQRNFYLSINTLNLLDALQPEGVRALPLKGSLLSLQIYDNLALREPGDIDLLIDDRDSDRVLTLLKDLGYTWPLAQQWSPTQQRLYIAQQGEISCFSKEKSISVDLHFRWSGNPQLFTLDFEQAWQSATALTVSAAHTVRVLCPEHQMLYLSVHGAKHQWSRLSWLLDIAMLIQQPLDWTIVQYEAERLNIQRPIHQALALVEDFLGAVPATVPAIYSKQGQPPATQWLIDSAIANLQTVQPHSLTGHFDSPPATPHEIFYQTRYQMKLKPNLAYKLTAAKRLLFSARDWQVLQLPEPLWFLYVVLRPLLYCWRAIASQRNLEANEQH
ncbi:MAG: nucleotidyltransferase family protein [Phormidesmis sp.]